VLSAVLRHSHGPVALGSWPDGHAAAAVEVLRIACTDQQLEPAELCGVDLRVLVAIIASARCCPARALRLDWQDSS